MPEKPASLPPWETLSVWFSKLRRIQDKMSFIDSFNFVIHMFAKIANKTIFICYYSPNKNAQNSNEAISGHLSLYTGKCKLP